MKLSAVCLSLLLVAGLGASFLANLHAAITAEQRKEIGEIRKELDKVKGLVSKKKLDEADKILTESEQKLKKIALDAAVKENDPALAPLFRSLELNKQSVEKKKGGPAGISFAKEVAPIISRACGNCHGSNNPRGGLRMDTFAGMERGGTSGPLLTIGNPNLSRIVLRITQSGNNRMPRGEAPLPAADIQKIAAWIAQGAKFDGESKDTPIEDLAAQLSGEAVQIVKATGNEKVSFVRDIAPFMANLCVNCHGGPMPRAGFSLDTFEKLMRGGRNGRVIIPGNSADSRLWHLVGLQDPIKMPQGQALITRSNHRNLQTWIDEGAKFDGEDAKARLASLVPTTENAKAKELATLNATDFLKLRKDRIAELWKLGLPNEKSTQVEGKEVIVVGNTSEARLKEISDWAEDDAKMLKRTFNDKGETIWRGKLALFIFKDRFTYQEFTRTTAGFDPPSEATGHARVTASTMEDAYVCLPDIGDSPSETSPGLRAAMLDHVTAAMLLRSPRKVSDWIARGTGLALAARANSKNPYFAGITDAAKESVKGVDLNNPNDLFDDGRFSPAEVGPVGYTLVTHMLALGGDQKFVAFLNQMQTGTALNAALTSVYSSGTTALARSYLTALANTKPAVKKK